jgi:hypothetical protein
VDASPSRLVGVLVVHGVGDQKPLDTARKLVKGLLKADGDDMTVIDENPSAGTITSNLAGSDATLRIYEVYWAKLFEASARGSFDVDKVQSVALFPLLTRRHGLYRPPRSGFSVFVSTLLLVPLSILAYSACSERGCWQLPGR